MLNCFASVIVTTNKYKTATAILLKNQSTIPPNKSHNGFLNGYYSKWVTTTLSWGKATNGIDLKYAIPKGIKIRVQQ